MKIPLNGAVGSWIVSLERNEEAAARDSLARIALPSSEYDHVISDPVDGLPHAGLWAR